jgi:hypothetical protein
MTMALQIGGTTVIDNSRNLVNIAGGTVPNATNVTGTATSSINSSALATGTANSTTYLRGDRTWQTISASAPTTAQVLAATAGASFGAVGTYAFLSLIGSTSETVIDGNTYAGSSLEPAGILRTNSGNAGGDVASSADATRGGTAVSGTWRAMGRVGTPSRARDLKITLYLRIS